MKFASIAQLVATHSSTHISKEPFLRCLSVVGVFIEEFISLISCVGWVGDLAV